MSTIDTVDATPSSYLYYRHTLPVRIMHWINVIALTILLHERAQHLQRASGAVLGQVVVLRDARPSCRSAPWKMRTTAHRHDAHLRSRIRHDGISRRFARCQTARSSRASFPSWLTIPGNRWLSMARHWHFFFAWMFVINGLCYVALCDREPSSCRAISRPTRADWRSIGRSIIDHLRFRHPTGEASKRYNVLQKLAYLSVIFVLLPLVILMGFAMSPGLDALIAGLGRLVRRTPVGAHDSFHRRMAAGRVRADPRLRGHHHADCGTTCVR